jgi:hypothetical protein
MSFFTDIDGMTILERNSSRLEGLQMNEARKLIKQYKIAREDLKLQLLSVGDNSFTEARLKNTLIQIELGIQALERRSQTYLQQAFDFVSESGIEDGAKEVNYFERKYLGISESVPVDQILLTTQPETLLLNRYQSSIETYNQTLRNKIQAGLTQALLQNKTWSQAVNDFGGLFDAEEWQLARIVRTELHSIYGQSKNNGFQTIQDQYLPDLKKTLYHPMDSRTGDDSKVAASKNLIAPVDEPFEYSFQQGSKTIKRTFMAPPDIPNDRSILIPYRSEWNK